MDSNEPDCGHVSMDESVLEIGKCITKAAIVF